MPIYNKITLNGTTLIDLSTDTVAVADDIASGKVGHLNTGATATGTHSGGGLSGVSASFYVLGKFYYIDENCVSQSGQSVSLTTITALAGSYIVILVNNELATGMVNCTVVATESLGSRAKYRYMEILQVSGGA